VLRARRAGPADAPRFELPGEAPDAVLHLAGESILGRWTAAKKRRIRGSRVAGTRGLCEALAGLPKPPAVFVSGSATGYYGDRGDEVLTEDSAAGRGFLADVCREWEAASAPLAEKGTRVAHLRTGIVLAAHGGALAQMLLPFKLGLGGRLGHGRQYMSWITLDDWVGAALLAWAKPVKGPWNLTAPAPVTNEVFTKSLGRALRRPTVLPAPAAAMTLLLGEMAREVLLSGARALPARLTSAGYRFRHETLDAALAAVLR
jgi:uncharacterized protein